MNIYNSASENGFLDSLAVVLTNVLRQRGILPSDKIVYGIDEKQLQQFYH